MKPVENEDIDDDMTNPTPKRKFKCTKCDNEFETSNYDIAGSYPVAQCGDCMTAGLEQEAIIKLKYIAPPSYDTKNYEGKFILDKIDGDAFSLYVIIKEHVIEENGAYIVDSRYINKFLNACAIRGITKISVDIEETK